VATPIAVEAACAPGDLDGVRAEIVAILRQELALGLRETGEDEGPPLDRYWGSSGIPWCAAFATWVWRQAGVAIPRSAYSGYFMEWGARAGTWRALGEAPPEPGDALVWGDGNGDGKTDHVDIVESVLPDGRVVVIGGNVSDAVTRKAPFDPGTARNGSGAPVLGYAQPTGSVS
jgi:hypothetical protein